MIVLITTTLCVSAIFGITKYSGTIETIDKTFTNVLFPTFKAYDANRD